MTVARRTKRGKKGTRRIDLSPLRQALRDGRTWTKIGIVTSDEGASHFEVTPEDILVEVELVPDDERVTCRLGLAAGGVGRGVVTIPRLGEEVVVIIPDGELECGGVIVAFLSTSDPITTEGPSENRTVVVNDEVLVHDGSGGTEPLVKQSQLDSVVSTFNGHTHQVLAAPSLTPLTTGGASGMSAGTGTTILKAK